MKKSLTLLNLLLMAVLVSCSDDTTTSTPEEQSLELEKTVSFYPDEAGYEASVYSSEKHVQYFQNGHIIADTVFDYQHQASEIVTHTYQGNVYTQSYAYNNVTNRIVEITYDSQERITQIKRSFPNTYTTGTPVRIYTVVYNTDNTVSVTESDEQSGESFPPLVYTTNNDGFINGYLIEGAPADGLVYNDDKPLSTTFFDESVSFSYYDVNMPENFKKSMEEMNNTIILRVGSGFIDEVARYCNYYIKSYDGNATFETTFNNLNYPVYTKGDGSLHQTPYEGETYFYYND